jgi:hypothetical protein
MDGSHDCPKEILMSPPPLRGHPKDPRILYLHDHFLVTFLDGSRYCPKEIIVEREGFAKHSMENRRYSAATPT